MYKRLTILTIIIVVALSGLTVLGYHAVSKWAEGLQWKRMGEFAATAEAIKRDVNRKLYEFMQREQNRPYSDYQYYYVPDNVMQEQQQMPLLLRSPLADKLYNDFAYGNFQINADGSIVTPYHTTQGEHEAEQDELAQEINLHIDNVRQNLLPVLGSTSGSFGLSLDSNIFKDHAEGVIEETSVALEDNMSLEHTLGRDENQRKGNTKLPSKGKIGQAKEFAIESLKQESQKTQVLVQLRSVVESNTAQGVVPEDGEEQEEPPQDYAGADKGQTQHQRAAQTNAPTQIAEQQSADSSSQLQAGHDIIQTQSEPVQLRAKQLEQANDVYGVQQPAIEEPQPELSETVQIKIEPFIPVVVAAEDKQSFIFGGQVFLLRRVQIEDQHFLQGFQLNEKEIVEEVKDSAAQAVATRERMSFELPQMKNGKSDYAAAEYTTTANESIAYTAILDFGFGEFILNLIDTDPAWIGKQISWLRKWYLGITAVVLSAVALGLGSLWLNAKEQLKLAQKKDDFISAVSHELRTPLTSIRMYSEMLEKNWVKSENKLVEYYKNMRAESERLTRLIENVLDFSKIQRGRKKYTFSVGDINKCITEIVDMMRPYAAESGFSIKTDFGQLMQTSFDSDAVTQIVVNLLDNAIKYARHAEDKTITVRTKHDGQFVIIEVEDHGPGVPHRQHKKVFEQFYRSAAEATRETTGTGLGLALVKKFAEAHNGFVEIISAKPTGAIFRVALATQV